MSPRHRATVAWTEIAGYRIVRRLPSCATEERAIGRTDEGGVAIRRIPDPVPEIVENAVQAQAAVGEHRHVAGVRDLAIEPDGVLVVVTELVTGPSVRELRMNRGADWRLGHVATVLIPIATTMAELHDRGITVGRLTHDALRVDPSGAPVLTEFTDAVVTAPLPARLRAQDAHYLGDEHALLAFAAELAEGLGREDSAVLEAVLVDGESRSGGGESASSLPHRLADRLFAATTPLPLLAPTVASPVPSTASGSAAGSQEPRANDEECEPSEADQPLPRREALARSLGALGLPSTITTPVLEAAARVERECSAVRARFRTASRRTVVLTGLVGASIAAVLVSAVLGLEVVTAPPADPHEDGLYVSPGGGDGVAGSGGLVATHPGDRPEGFDESPLSLAEPEGGEWAEVVSALVAEWSRCARGQERLCETALHRESAAADRRLHERDSAQVEALVTMVEDAPSVQVLERMGSAVIVMVEASDAPTTTASLLLMRSEAGWRIRDVLSERGD